MTNIKPMTPLRLIRMQELTVMIGYHSSSINHMIQEGRFPQRIKIGARASGWLLPEIKSWINQTWQLGQSYSPALLEEFRLLNRKQVLSILGIKRDSLYRMIEREEFPAGKVLSRRECRWDYNDVMSWLAGKIQERDLRDD